MRDSGGWDESAEAWVSFVDYGDPNRECILDPAMIRICGVVVNQQILDVGCGEGRFCRMLTRRGAQTVGIDPTASLVQIAHDRGPQTFLVATAEKLPFAADTFDLVVSYLSLIDIPDFRTAIHEMVRVLKPGGRLIVANLTGIATANNSGWHRDAEGNKLHFPVDRYFEERGEEVSWQSQDRQEISIVNYHRPLASYLMAFLATGLRLTRYEEPVPTAESVRLSRGSRPPFEFPIFASWSG